MSRFVRTWVTVAVVSVITPLTTAAALANPPSTTVTMHVTSAAGDPVPHVFVYGDQTDAADTQQPTVLFGTTNSDGDIIKSDGAYGGGTAFGGEWQFSFIDADRARDLAGTSYALSSMAVHLDDGVENVLPTTVVQPGSRLVGSATAPSGKKIRGLDVELTNISSDEWSRYAVGTDDEPTDTFAVNGLSPGPYSVSADVTGHGNSYRYTGQRVTFSDYGQTKALALKDLQITCSSVLRAESTKKGAVTLHAFHDAHRFGISKPGGRYALYRDGKALKRDTWTGSSKTFHLTNQPTGKTVTYKLNYAGGDCLKSTAKRAVSVKK